MEKKKLARRSSGNPYECKQNWEENTGVQCGDIGAVFSKEGGYTTAFFEAFPKKPRCFIRGEGKDVEEAELNAWNKYQKIIQCDHEMERRDRTDGYGYCKHCSYSSMVFEPLTKCCKCNKPTNYIDDIKGNFYCKKHSRFIPIKLRVTGFFTIKIEKRPRKYKKQLTKAVKVKFLFDGIVGKVTRNKYGSYFCKGYRLPFLFKRQELNLIKKYK